MANSPSVVDLTLDTCNLLGDPPTAGVAVATTLRCSRALRKLTLGGEPRAKGTAAVIDALYRIWSEVDDSGHPMEGGAFSVMAAGTAGGARSLGRPGVTELALSDLGLDEIAIAVLGHVVLRGARTALESLTLRRLKQSYITTHYGAQVQPPVGNDVANTLAAALLLRGGAAQLRRLSLGDCGLSDDGAYGVSFTRVLLLAHFLSAALQCDLQWINITISRTAASPPIVSIRQVSWRSLRSCGIRPARWRLCRLAYPALARQQ